MFNNPFAGGWAAGVSFVRRFFVHRQQFSRFPEHVMGTNTMLKVVVGSSREADAHAALEAAEFEMRRIEQLLSRWLPRSEIGRLNSAAEGVVVPVSAETLQLLHDARRACEETDGAFDASALPLFLQWQKASREDREPSGDELNAVLPAIRWQGIELLEDGVRKTHSHAGIDPGGIGKGYAVDRAVAVLLEQGVQGGLVQCGGDTRVFGLSERNASWRIGLHDPLADYEHATHETMHLHDRAVSTSGDYERFVTIRGEPHSHILDPRTGEAIRNVPQTTVIGGTAMQTDVWSTALSVLGQPGLNHLPDTVEAHMILRTDGPPQSCQTDGFGRIMKPVQM